jgi:hypothetical protein
VSVVRNNAIRSERMRSALVSAPQSYDNLVAISGLAKPSVARWVKALRAMSPRPIYIAAWADDARGRKFVPMFRWGVLPDAPRPGDNPEAAAARMRALRARKKLETT